MPNQPRPDNRARPIRITDRVWAKVQKAAEQQGVTASEIVRRAVAKYLGEK